MVRQPRRTSGLTGPLAALALAVGLAAPVRALFVKSQMDRLDTEPLLDSEYFADRLGFSVPAEWDREWRASTLTYRANGASLDCCDMLLDQDLRLRQRLLESLDFKFRFWQRSDKEVDEMHSQLEFEQRLPAGLSIAAFGEPTFNKEDSDFGLGLAWKPRAAVELSARRTFVDFSLNRRGVTAQRYAREPATDEFAASFPAGNARVRAGLELDHPLRREIPADGRSYAYRRTSAFAEARMNLAGWQGFGEYAFEYHHEGDIFDPDPALKSLDYRRRTHRLMLGAEGPLSARDRLEAGHGLVLRWARADNPRDSGAGIMYRRWESQPYARWRRRLSDLVTTEVGTFLSLGEMRKRYPAHLIPSIFDIVAEAKLGTGLDFTFAPGRVGIYANWDLDDWGHPWDGGNVRALVRF